MRRIFLLLLLLFLHALAADDNASGEVLEWNETQENSGLSDIYAPLDNETLDAITEDATGRQLYATVASLPKQLFVGQIFSIEIRAVVTTGGIEELRYRFNGGRDVERIETPPVRRYTNHTFYDRIYFKATGPNVRLPDITPILVFSRYYAERYAPIAGESIETTTLNPPKDFSGLIAKEVKILHTKTTPYDRDHVILVFMADVNQSDAQRFHLPQATAQGFESFRQERDNAAFTYYAVLPKTLHALRLSYFDLGQKEYRRLKIPIVVEDDSVSTQSDLKPTEQSHDFLKALVFGGLAAILLIAAAFKRSWFFFLLAVGAGGYAAWLGAPIRHVCIKQGSPLYLLPMRNATVFEIAPTNYELEVEGHIDGYTKVKLHNDKIGWVKDEDTCTH